MAPTLDLDFVRSHFPILKTGYIFADNAGGSQIAKDAADRVYDYLLNTNVQLGADYSMSVKSTNKVLVESPQSAMKLFNAKSEKEIVFGPSTTANLENLCRGMEVREEITAEHEIIITGEHEANAGPWKKLAKRVGTTIKYWHAKPTNPENPYSIAHHVEDLLPLITSKTRIIAFTGTSNILGSVLPVREIVKAARAKAAEVGSKKVEFSIDCVAYAPHRLIDVQDWDVEYCVFSYYKIYGPHVSALYTKQTSLETSVGSIAHHFLTSSLAPATPYKIQPGGPGYEAVYGTTAVVPYLLSLSPENDLKASFEAIANHEQKLLHALLGYLLSDKVKERGVRVVGREVVDKERVPTVSFVVRGEKPIKSQDVVKAFDEAGNVGIRWGHFYAYTLVEHLFTTISPNATLDDINDAVVRISLVHYNTVEEVERMVKILDGVLFGGSSSS